MIKLYSDGADFDGIVDSAQNPNISGFTTNPTLMNKAGITDYESFARKTIEYLSNTRPETCLSLEVFADTQDEMIRQAKIINSWSNGYKIYIKIPITNTSGEYTTKVIRALTDENININITAVLSNIQVEKIMASRKSDCKTPTIISVFAGRIADTGLDPEYIIERSRLIRFDYSDDPLTDNIEFLWASPREAFNYVQAERSQCDIITMTPELIRKVSSFGKSLDSVSLDTVKMFYNDAVASCFKIGE